MVTTTDFNVTEAGFRAVIQTCWNLDIAVSEQQRQLDAACETIAILHHRLDHLTEVANRSYS